MLFDQMSGSYGACDLGLSWFYEHLVPLGPKTAATKNTDWFVVRTLETGH